MERRERGRVERVDPNAIRLNPKQYARLLHIVAELEAFAQIEEKSYVCAKAARRLKKLANRSVVRWGKGRGYESE